MGKERRTVLPIIQSFESGFRSGMAMLLGCAGGKFAVVIGRLRNHRESSFVVTRFIGSLQMIKPMKAVTTNGDSRWLSKTSDFGLRG